MGNPHRDRHRRRERDARREGSGGDYQNRGFADAFQQRYGKIDVSVDGLREQQQQQQGSPRDRPPRPKLEFREVAVLREGDCAVRITAADGKHGRIYNFTVERIGRDRPSRYFRDVDCRDLAGLVLKVPAWIDDAKQQGKNRSG